jgi:murein DD-endopeptidase MepM/ murein hydrolase activator NlpD
MLVILAATVPVALNSAGGASAREIASPLVAGPAAHADSAFTSPVPGTPTVVTPFDPPKHRYGAGHRGVDLAATVGSPVFAAGPGTVVYAGPLADRGVISVEHAGGLRTTYEPVHPVVARGDEVAAGELIGTVEPGHARCAPAVCVHWGARLPGRVYLDPMSLLGPCRVRLKPWSGG